MSPRNPLTADEIKARSGRVVKYPRLTKIGEYISNIELLSTSTHWVNIKNIAQHANIILFFYPGNRSGLEFPELMGCTPQSCSFRDHSQTFRNLNTTVFGVSMQTTAVQSQFAAEHHLQFELLSDSAGKLAAALGIDTWQTNTNNQIFTARETIFIQQGGNIKIHLKNITFNDIDTHVTDLLAQIKNLV